MAVYRLSRKATADLDRIYTQIEQHGLASGRRLLYACFDVLGTTLSHALRKGGARVCWPFEEGIGE